MEWVLYSSMYERRNRTSSEVSVNVNNLQLLSLAINFSQIFYEAFQRSKIPRIKITRNSKLPGYKSVAGIQISKDFEKDFVKETKKVKDKKGKNKEIPKLQKTTERTNVFLRHDLVQQQKELVAIRDAAVSRFNETF